MTRSLLKKGFLEMVLIEKDIRTKIYFLGDQAIANPATLHGNGG